MTATRTARRKVLKSAALAGSAVFISSKALPNKWSKPVIEAVVLPAHAQTTCCDIAGIYCGSPDGSSASIEITVSADGTTVVRTEGEMATTSVGCGGGEFDVVTDGDNWGLTGTVNCGQTTITGVFTRLTGIGSPVSFNYTATTTGCID